MKHYYKETTSKGDICECVYCGHLFNGRKATNGNMDETVITCPECERDMNVYTACEFLCREIETT